MAPPRKQIIHSGTVSGSGTTVGNQVVDFSPRVVNNLIVYADSGDLNISFNDEVNSHLIKKGSAISIDGLKIAKIKLIDAGITYRFSGAYY